MSTDSLQKWRDLIVWACFLFLFVLCKRLIERQEGSDLKKERNVWHNADDSFSGTPPGTEVEGLKPKNQKLLSQTWGFYYWILNSLQAFYNFWCL